MLYRLARFLAIGSWPRRWLYTVIASFLAVGAPLGFLLLRAWCDGRLGWGWAVAEVRSQPLVYGYLGGATSVVFVFLGWLLGGKEDLLREASTTDALTRLANRRFFDQRLREELGRSRRFGTPLTLLVADVDGLKAVNDRAGHEAGDEALRAVSECLRQHVRSTDVSARIGGDEFAVIAPMTSSEQGLELAHRIRSSLASDAAQRPTLSIGVADVETTGSVSPEALFAAADRALYEAKSTGKDRALNARSLARPGAQGAAGDREVSRRRPGPEPR